MQEFMSFLGNHQILSLVWVALFIAVIVLTAKGMFSKVKIIGRSEAIQLINKEEAIVVDLRSREEFRKGHISSSVNLTPSEIKNNSLGELDKHKTQPIIVTCATGTTSREPAEKLFKAGFERVYILKEGVTGWQGENFPLVKGK